MSDVTLKSIGDMNPYEGPHAIAGITFRPAARELGVSAWGMNVLELEAGCTGYPEHDHADDGQEETYVVLSGSGTLRIGNQDLPLSTGTLARVGPAEKRKVLPRPDSLTVLAIGARPGEAYTPRG